MEVWAAEISAIDKEELVAQGFAGAFRFTHESAYVADACFCVHVHYLSHYGGAQKVLDAEFEGAAGLNHMDVFAVVGKGECDIGPCDGYALEFFHNMP